MKFHKLILFTMALLFLCSCSSQEYPTQMEESPSPTIDQVQMPQRPQTLVYSDINGIATIDYSQQNQGYINAKLQTQTDGIKLQIVKDDETYNYDLIKTEYTSFPLQMGDGSYQLKIMQQVEGTKYANIGSITIDVQVSDPLLVFLLPNQIVDYTADDLVIQTAFELTKDDKTTMERIHSIYEYVIHTITYDDDKALAVEGKFVLPDMEGTLQKKSGICFDYAAILTAMLRSQQIPARLITGYTDSEYHSWVQVWLENEGWVDPHVFFEKEEWTTIDPTYAAAKKDYNGEYKTKYIY